MKLDKNKKILIVGLGLMGGSYARALTKKGYTVEALTRSQSSVDYALGEKIISRGFTEPCAESVGDADIIVFALYPHIFSEWIDKYQDLIKPGAVITDVTGVKSCIVYDIQKKLRKDVEFIAAHPMAGREVYGVENSDEKIFKGANYIVTPTDVNTQEAINLCKTLGEELGFERISVLAPETHDEMIAFLSQLTHCIAVSLMTSSDNPRLCDYTGDSFRDLTRIARINDDMWSELFLLNREALLKEMNAFEGEFSRLKSMIEKNDRDGMREMMKKSTARRALFDK